MSFSGLSNVMTPLTQPVLGAFRYITQDRTREMIFEDFAGFGMIRTGMDLSRGYFYGTGKPNWDAGRERLVREAASIATDNMLPGILAAGLGSLWYFNNPLKHKAAFAQFDHLKLIEGFAKAAEATGKQRRVVYEEMAEAFANSVPKVAEKASAADLKSLFNAETIQKLSRLVKQPKQLEAKSTELAVAIANKLGRKQFDLTVNGRTVMLDEFIQDLSRFEHQVAEKAKKTLGQSTSERFTKTLEETLENNWAKDALKVSDDLIRFKKLRLLGIVGGFITSIAVAPFNVWLTRRLSGMTTYPGELGLVPQSGQASLPLTSVNPLVPPAPHTLAQPFPVAMTTNRPFGKTYFQQFLPDQNALNQTANFPVGMSAPSFGQRTVSNPLQSNLSLTADHPTHPASEKPAWHPANWMKKWMPYMANSLEKGNVLPLGLTSLWLVPSLGFFDSVSRKLMNPLGKEVLLKAFDFGKAFPYTTQQQMSTIYGGLIISRLLSARSPSEFRERFVDSALAWSIWIMGTPFLKKALAGKWDENLLKKVGDSVVPNALRSEKEIRHFFGGTNTTLAKKWVGLGALATTSTIVLLGVVEPLISIFLTKWQVRHDQHPASIQK